MNYGVDEYLYKLNKIRSHGWAVESYSYIGTVLVRMKADKVFRVYLHHNGYIVNIPF